MRMGKVIGHKWVNITEHFLQTRSLVGVGKEKTAISYKKGISATHIGLELTRSTGSAPMITEGLVVKGCVKAEGNICH